MPSDLLLKSMNAVHRAVLTVSCGHLGWNAGRMPVVELTTTGRKTGRKHTVMLTSPVQEGESYVIVASKGGEDTHPAWYLNLVADPEVDVKIKGTTRSMHARVLDDAERARLWPQVTKAYAGYAGYQRRTTRQIPLVVLEPAA